MTNNYLHPEAVDHLEEVHEEIHTIFIHVRDNQVKNEALEDALINAQMYVSVALDAGTPVNREEMRSG